MKEIIDFDRAFWLSGKNMVVKKIFKIRGLIFIPIFSLMMSACISVSVDERPIAQQREDFDRASAALIGEYSIVDSRKDDFSVTSFTVSVRGNNLIVVGHQKREDNFIITGKECSGRDRGIGKSIYCGKESGAITYVSLELLYYSRSINSAWSPFSKPAMDVKPGDYLLEFGTRNGRTSSYLIKKTG
ncbi:hypothetical protein [Pandoraea sp. NPDC090278]|uniref:hypothetical protein n=1 Tax=Pandoraea sp. NPDC090278 TaxID=3364391 RepID=UPI00383A27E8